MKKTSNTTSQSLVRNLKVCRDQILKLEQKAKLAMVEMTGFAIFGGVSLKENAVLGVSLLLGSAIALGYTYQLNKKKNYFLRRENRLYKRLENDEFYQNSADEELDNQDELTLNKTR